MPTSETGTWTEPRWRRAGAGFTLIELLVVMFIIGLLVSLPLLSVNLGGRDQRLQQEAERLWQLMRLAADEALLQGLQIGLQVAPDDYRFLYQEQVGGPWSPMDSDRLRQRDLPDGVELRVEVEGVRIVIDEAKKEDEEGEKPQLFFLSSGEIIPAFAVELLDRDTERLWRIEPGRSEVLTLVSERY